jgi:hypothetical protein
MLNQPMSSPQMMRMFGFLLCAAGAEAGACPAAGVCVAAAGFCCADAGVANGREHQDEYSGDSTMENGH